MGVQVLRMSRVGWRAFVGLLACGVAAGCSGSSMTSRPTPSASDKVICHAVREIATLLPAKTMASIAPQLAAGTTTSTGPSAGITGRINIGASPRFIARLTHSHRAAFERAGVILDHGDVIGFEVQASKECSALGL